MGPDLLAISNKSGPAENAECALLRLQAEMAQSERGERKTIWVGIVWVLTFNLVNVIWILERPFGPAVFVAGTDALGILAGALGGAWCLGTAVLFARSRSMRLRDLPSPLLMAAGLLCFGVGQAFYAYPEVVQHAAPSFPGWADVFFLAMYPLTIAAILRIPTRPLSLASRIRVFLDSAMIMTAAIAFSWYFVLGPTMLAGSQTLLGRIVALSYPVLDLVMLLSGLLLASRADSRSARFGIGILLLGLLSFVVGDSIYLFRLLHKTYHTGSPMDAAFAVALTMMALGTSALRPAALERSADAASGAAPPLKVESQSLWRLLISYAFFPALMVLLLYTRTMPDHRTLERGVFASSVVLVGLILLRQILAIRENHMLNRALASAYRETAAYAERMQSMNAELHATQAELKVSIDALTQANDHLHAMATTDVLTGLPNRRAMVTAVDAEIERSVRYGRPCTLVFLDLDHFKALNDTRGHQAGDDSLSQMALYIRDALRASDIVGRWGGEEFVAILPETDTAGAKLVAQELRRRIEQHEFSAAAGLRLTCSIGVATFPADAAGRDALIAAADKAMYAAKQLGRNQVCLASDLTGD